MIKETISGCSLLLVSATALAGGCDSPRTPYDVTYCAALEMVQLDQEINVQYKKVMGLLTQPQKQTLKQSQIEWLKNRDSQCSDDSMINVGCSNKTMQSRIDFLKSVERECKSTGCDSKKLAQQQ
ncbi:lysozyme inhibitor LprI family protein [Serratia fonticola]|uniref:lysozyme inhibitor LprI family protein n=1 Tax=Serratia fonticola TaxID=47917 RepID=UPI0021AD846F|nr:lysozyme inhibitor LprI family protein [Serratia fonticola]